MFSEWIARKTMRPRHWLVRKIAPTLYLGCLRDRGVGVPRPMTLFIKDYLKGPLVGAEIGVGMGTNALNLLKMLDMKRLYLIDPYVSYFEITGVVDYHNEAEWDLVKRRMQRFSEVRFFRMSSDKAVSNFPDGSLDFVYVDGNHAGWQVAKDLRNYWPKIKIGGVLGGHDWKRPDFEVLINAVMRFGAENDLVVHGELMDYWFIKGE